MEFVGVTDAARQLGVTTRQVQHLVASGDLRLVARGLIDRTSLDRHLATRQGSRKRAWSESNAWGAVALLSGQHAFWMGPSQRSRLKGVLRQLTADQLVSRTRNRAQVQRYQGHSRAAERLRRELVDTASATAALGLTGIDRVDGYLDAQYLDETVARHALIEAPGGRYTLRATTMDLTIVRSLADSGSVLAALDLAESLDVRERQAGLRGLAAALRRPRD
ncbi:hypothetical protein [Haloechinothrix halophila]|uniref:hypothetical protein n=1 Tax=Haloechinothrix halophila TaxID=1069073 RepID=UPI00054DECFF|nr:hypothetical protein [Haloechinothrix halophila]